MNQLLGTHPDCLVLSEVNPSASVLSVAEQGFRWLDLINGDELGELDRFPYSQLLHELHGRAAADGSTLIIRDWVTINFLPRTVGDTVTPSYTLEQQHYIQRAHLDMLPLVVTRRASPVFNSIRRCFTHLSELTASDFGGSYLAYAQAVKAFPKVKLESLREKPLEATRALLEKLELDVSPAKNLIENFHAFQNCTGNTTLKSPTASVDAKGILPMAEERVSAARPVAAHALFREADRLLGYE